LEGDFFMMNIIGRLSGFVGKYLTYIVLVVVVWAYFMPNAFLWAVPNTVLLLGVVMFGMGMTLHATDFKLILQRPREVLIGTTCHYTIMPIIAYLLVLAFQLPPELAVGMVLLGSCPSGTASNVMSFLAKGDVPLAVSITTVSTLLAPIMMPFLVWALAGQWVEVSFMAMAMTVMKVILLPLVLGLIVHRIIGEAYLMQLSKALVLISAFAVLTIVGGVIAINGEKIIELGFFMIAMVLIHNLLGFAIGYFATGKLGLGKRQQHSVTLEVGMQNDALAISLVSVFFAPAVAIPAAVGAAIHQITGSILAGIFARNIDKIEARNQDIIIDKNMVSSQH
jgi:BASS family bile acid:Na+ symporter